VGWGQVCPPPVLAPCAAVAWTCAALRALHERLPPRARRRAQVNVSVEKTAEGRLAGYIRIRSKTQGIALSLGDKITLKQKG